MKVRSVETTGAYHRGLIDHDDGRSSMFMFKLPLKSEKEYTELEREVLKVLALLALCPGNDA